LRDQLLRQEKDEASLSICFRQDSLNAFIPRLAVSGGFFIYSTVVTVAKIKSPVSALVSQSPTFPQIYSAEN
jgi:hypothetical protein